MIYYTIPIILVALAALLILIDAVIIWKEFYRWWKSK